MLEVSTISSSLCLYPDESELEVLTECKLINFHLIPAIF